MISRGDAERCVDAAVRHNELEGIYVPPDVKVKMTDCVQGLISRDEYTKYVLDKLGAKET